MLECISQPSLLVIWMKRVPRLAFNTCEATSMALPVAVEPNSVLLRGWIAEVLIHRRVVHQLLGVDIELVVIAHRRAVGRVGAQVGVQRVEQLEAALEAGLAGGVLVVLLMPAVGGNHLERRVLARKVALVHRAIGVQRQEAWGRCRTVCAAETSPPPRCCRYSARYCPARPADCVQSAPTSGSPSEPRRARCTLRAMAKLVRQLPPVSASGRSGSRCH